MIKKCEFCGTKILLTDKNRRYYKKQRFCSYKCCNSGENNPSFGISKLGMKNPMWGRKQTKEAKQKIVNSMNTSGKNNGMFGKKQSLKFYRWRKNTVFPTKDTSIEIKIQKFLKQLKIEFLTHQYMHIEHGYQCDILIPSMNLVIECFGNYWHKYPIGREIDTLRCKEMREKRFRVLVFWEKEIKVMELNDFKEKLEIQNGQ